MIMETEGKRLLWRIEKKTEEIKSLWDGVCYFLSSGHLQRPWPVDVVHLLTCVTQPKLFSATSLPESTKAIALNQAIYVFTIVTVIYTPIGLLAVSYSWVSRKRPIGIH